MAIDPQAPNELAQQATGTGGVTKTLTGLDVLPGQMSLDLGIDNATDASGEEYEVAGLSDQVGRKITRAVGRALSPQDNTFNKALDRLEELEAARDADPEGFEKNKLIEEIKRQDAAEKATPEEIEQRRKDIKAKYSNTDTAEKLTKKPEGFPPELQDAVDEVRKRLDEQQDEPLLLQNPADSPEELEALGFGPEFDENNKATEAAFKKGNTHPIADQSVQNVLDDINLDAPIKDGMLTDFRAVGSKGDAKIPDEGRIYSTLEAVSKQYSKRINNATRGVIEEEATRQMADLLGLTPSTLRNAILNRKTGGVINVDGMGLAESMLAARDLLLKEISVLDELAKKAEFGGEAEAATFRAQLELVAQLQANIKGSQTEIARALGSFKIPARTGQGDTEMMMSKDLVAMLESFGGTEDIREMAKMYNQQAVQPHQKAAFAKFGAKSKFKRVSDAFYESWINLILSNPITHVKNILGVVLTNMAHTTETYVAAGIGTGRRALGGEGGTYFSQANAQIFASIMSINDAFAGAGRAFRTGESQLPGTKIEGQAGNRPGAAFSSEGMMKGWIATGIDGLGHVMTMGRVPTRALEAEDTFFKVIAMRASLYENALSSGLSLNLKDDALVEHIANFLFDPPETAIVEGQAHAKYLTLQNDLDATGKTLSNLRKIPTFRYFSPFIKTPYNSFKYVYRDRSPLGVASEELRGVINRGRGPGATQLDKQMAERAVARLSIGTLASVAFATWTLQGNFTGAGPADRGMRENLRAQGWRPYSYVVPGTKTKELPMGQHVSLTAFEPFSTLFMVSADMSEVMMEGSLSEADRYELAGHMAAMFAHQLTDKTMMSGFSNLISTLNDPTRYAGSTLDSFIQSGVPRVVAEAKKQGVPFLADADPVVRNARTALDQIRANVPGWSKSLPPRRNVFGQVRILDGKLGPDMISPIYSSAIGPNEFNPDPEFNQKVVEVSQVFADVGYNPKMPSNMLFNEADKFSLEAVEMTPEMEDLFLQKHGELAIKMLEPVLADETVQTLIELTKEGDALSKDILKQNFNKAFRDAREQAKAFMETESEFAEEIKILREARQRQIQKSTELIDDRL